MEDEMSDNIMKIAQYANYQKTILVGIVLLNLLYNLSTSFFIQLLSLILTIHKRESMLAEAQTFLKIGFSGV